MKTVQLHPDTEIIKQFAFCGKDIEKVIINDSLQKAYSAFMGCNNIEEIIINNKIVPHDIFGNCGHNKGINIYLNNTEIIEANAFIKCHIKNISFSKNIEKIEELAFFNSTFDKNVLYLPKSIKYIGRGAFNHTNLADIYIPDNIEYLGRMSECCAKIHMSEKTFEKLAYFKLSDDKFEVVIEKEQNLDELLDNFTFKEINKIKLEQEKINERI